MLPPVVLPGVVTSSLFAHQGGWDEILMVAVPVGLFAFLLYAANKRATRLAEQGGATGADESAPDETAPDGTTVDPAVPPRRPRGPI